jgi:tetratricopeptide (TPR) repeat protein
MSRSDNEKGRDSAFDRSASASEFRQGLAWHQQGRLPEAERHYHAALRSEPDHFEALHMLGVIALQMGRFERGVEIIRQAVSLNENSPIAFNNLAKGLKDLGRFEEAIVYFERAVVLAPHFADAQFSYGTALHLMDRFEDALVHFEKAIALNPKSIVALNNRGLALAKLKRFTEALASYDKALAIQPNFGDAHNNRGNALNALMRFDDALASFERAIAVRPDSAEAHCNRGNALLELEHFDDAAAAFDRAIAIRPDFVEAHRGGGDALAHLNRFDEAMASFDRAIAIKPRGRPSKGKPWLAAGISKATHYRREEKRKLAQADTADREGLVGRETKMRRQHSLSTYADDGILSHLSQRASDDRPAVRMDREVALQGGSRGSVPVFSSSTVDAAPEGLDGQMVSMTCQT